ncbi:hypothetical protein [Tardiphaga sp. 367_B4_N1_1]|uniref:hypothetical protein n=1 Tax=Tardiphaga sp. 367_B4_N1_1 TaxID=3240777 RepID=UPI003F218F2F
MSSNIPKAKSILRAAISRDNAEWDMHEAIVEALALMDRKKPTFVAKKRLKALTWRQKLKARELRSTGMSQNEIAIRLGTNHGRISEALEETEEHAA